MRKILKSAFSSLVFLFAGVSAGHADSSYRVYWERPLWDDATLDSFEQNPNKIPTCAITDPVRPFMTCGVYLTSIMKRYPVLLLHFTSAVDQVANNSVYTEYSQYRKAWRILNIVRLGWVQGLKEFLNSDAGSISPSQRDWFVNLYNTYKNRPFSQLASQEQFNAYRFVLGSGCEDPSSGTIRYLKDYFQDAIIIGAYRDGRDGQWTGQTISDEKLDVFRAGDIKLLGVGFNFVGAEYNKVLTKKRSLDAMKGQPGYDQALSRYEVAKYDFAKNIVEPYMASRLIDVTWKIWDRFQAFYAPMQALRKKIVASGCNGSKSWGLSDSVLFSIGLVRDIQFSQRDAACQKLKEQIDEIDAILNEQNSMKNEFSRMAPDQVLATYIAGYPDLYRLLVSRVRMYMGGDPFDGVFRIICDQYRLSEPAIARFLRPIGDWLNYLGMAAAVVPGGQGVAVASEVLGSAAAIGQHAAEMFGKISDAQFGSLFGVSRDEVQAAVYGAVGEGLLNLTIDLLMTGLQVRGYRSDFLRKEVGAEIKSVRESERVLTDLPTSIDRSRALNTLSVEDAVLIDRMQADAMISGSTPMSVLTSNGSGYAGIQLKLVEYSEDAYSATLKKLEEIKFKAKSANLAANELQQLEFDRLQAHAEVSDQIAAYFKQAGIEFEFKSIPSRWSGQVVGEFEILSTDSKSKVLSQLMKAVSTRFETHGAEEIKDLASALKELRRAVSSGRLTNRAREGVEVGNYKVVSFAFNGSTQVVVSNIKTGERVFGATLFEDKISDRLFWDDVLAQTENELIWMKARNQVVTRNGSNLYFNTGVLDGPAAGWASRGVSKSDVRLGKGILESIGLKSRRARGIDAVLSKLQSNQVSLRGKALTEVGTVDTTTLHELFHAKMNEMGGIFEVSSKGGEFVRSKLKDGIYSKYFRSDEFEARWVQLNQVMARKDRIAAAVSDFTLTPEELRNAMRDFYFIYDNFAQFYTVQKKILTFMKENPQALRVVKNSNGFNVVVNHTEYGALDMTIIDPKGKPFRDVAEFAEQGLKKLDDRAYRVSKNVEIFERKVSSYCPDLQQLKKANFNLNNYEYLTPPKPKVGP